MCKCFYLCEDMLSGPQTWSWGSGSPVLGLGLGSGLGNALCHQVSSQSLKEKCVCVCVCVCVFVCVSEGVTGCTVFTYETISPLSVVLLAEGSAEGGSGSGH